MWDSPVLGPDSRALWNTPTLFLERQLALGQAILWCPGPWSIFLEKNSPEIFIKMSQLIYSFDGCIVKSVPISTKLGVHGGMHFQAHSLWGEDINHIITYMLKTL